MYFANDVQANSLMTLIRRADTNFVLYLEYITHLANEVCDDNTYQAQYDNIWWDRFCNHPYVADVQYQDIVDIYRRKLSTEFDMPSPAHDV